MIDPKLQAELRAKFNPDGSDLRKMQLRMLEMLKYIDRVCQENGIKYWLSSGTCLGAVRHGGFIPWDDDVDIEISYRDRYALIDCLRKWNDKFILQDYVSDNEYLHAFPKLRDRNSIIKENNTSDKWNKYRGLFIDIFIIEPSNSRIVFRICGSMWSRLVLKCSKIQHKHIRKFAIKVLRFFLKTSYNLIRPLYYIQTHGMLRHSLGGMFPKPRYACDVVETLKVPFEDTELPIPSGYDHYLTSIYGNYMEIPSVSEIKSHTNTVKIW